jgi:hypothetical protein
MDELEEPRCSPLIRAVKCRETLLHIEIYEDGEGGWFLAVMNEQRVTNHWTESFKTERSALREALKTIREEGPKGFVMETQYKDVLQ